MHRNVNFDVYDSVVLSYTNRIIIPFSNVDLERFRTYYRLELLTIWICHDIWWKEKCKRVKGEN